MKTLYFEGAGCAERGEVENCRIRTAFKTDTGSEVYLEIIGLEVTKHTQKCYKDFKNVGIVDSCFYITGGHDESDHDIEGTRNKSFEYTKDNILKFVNSLGCSFDQVVILPDLAGYRVFKEKKGYNFGDEFIYNAELTARAEKIHAYFYNLEKSEGKKYPNFSIWVDPEKPALLHVLRHFNGYNKHWTVDNVETWQETITEAALGMYGC